MRRGGGSVRRMTVAAQWRPARRHGARLRGWLGAVRRREWGSGLALRYLLQNPQTSTCDGDLRTGTGQHFCNRQANTGAATCNQRVFAIQFTCHCDPPLFGFKLTRCQPCRKWFRRCQL